MIKTAPRHFMYSLLGTYAKFEATAGKQADLLNSQTKSDFAEMARIETEKLEQIQTFARTAATEKKWSLISSTTQNIISGSSLVLGALSLSSGKANKASMLMLASGVTGVASRIFSATGVYDKLASWMTSAKEMQEKIASRLEIGMQCASLGLGLVGGISAASSGVVTDVASQISSWIAPFSGFGQTGIKIIHSSVEKESKHASCFLQQSESLITQIYQRIHQTGKDAERLVHTIGEICESIKNAVHSLYTRV